MKKFLITLAALFALPIAAAAQSTFVYSAASGVSLLTGTPATATATGQARLPNFSGAGTLGVTETGVTGSPSGCAISLAYQQNNATTPSAAVFAQSFTPSTGTQTFAVAPSSPSGDNYVATYTCATYPTAGALNVSFSPLATASADPCSSSAKSSVAISQASAGTVQLVALSTGKKVYVCGVTDGSAGTTPSISLEYGTGSSCATGTAELTGAVPFTSGSAINIGSGAGTVAAAPTGNAVCALTVGNGHYGVLSYVQQ